MASKGGTTDDGIVPPIDAVPEKPDGSVEKYSAIELRLLDAEAKAKEKGNREADQRYWLRWFTIGVAFAIVLGMSGMVYHVSHKLVSLRSFGASNSYVIALYVAPIVSLTSLALALLVAAFRGYKEGDERTGMSAASQSAQATGMMG